MNCPYCRAVNPENAEGCAACGRSFASVTEGATIAPGASPPDPGATIVGGAPDDVDPAATLAPQPPSVAAGVLTPPPTPKPPSGSGISSGGGSTPSAASLTFTFAPGSDFGPRYRIESRIGEGGMGTVYKAYDKDLDRVVAIKLLRVGVADEASSMQRFKQELLLASKVSHKNILRIHDLGDVNGIKFISMAYIEGEDLHAELKRTGRLSPDRIVKIAYQLCSALDAAHSEGVVHRDLKPQNVLIDKQDNMYISDFGLAKSVEAGGMGMTRSGEFLGTPKYMSPEQVEAKPVDARSDLYSLGLMLYEMASGDVPFTGDSVFQVMYQRIKQKPKNIKTVNPELPDYLARIIMRCLEKEPKVRYQSAKEILADLNAERASLSAARSVQIALPVGANRMWLAIGAGLLLLLILVFAIPASRHMILPGGGGGSALSKAGVPAETTSLAILPFRNASGDAAMDWLGPSLAEMLRSDVGQSSSLRTVSADRVHQILQDLRLPANADFDPATLRRLAEFTNAQTLVWGQYLKVGDQIRIDANLQDLKRQRTIPLKIEAPNEKELLRAVEQLAGSIQQNLALSPDVLKELRAKSARPSSTSVQALRSYNEGLLLTRQGNNLEALKRFEAAAKEDPTFALAYSRLGQTYAALGYDDKAGDSSAKAVDLSEKLPAQERYLILANQALVLKDNKKAIESYENLAKVSPEDTGIQLSLARLYQDVGAYDKARDDLTKILAQDPKDVQALLSLGLVEIQRGNAQGSLDYLNRALSLTIQLENAPAKASALYLTGLAYRRLGKWDDALRSDQESLAIRRQTGEKRGIASSLAEIARVQQQQGKREAALKNYQEALQLRREMGDKRGTGDVLIDLGNFYKAGGQYDEALKLYKETLQIQRELGDPKAEATSLNNVGNIYVEKGQYEDGLTYFQQALQLEEKLKIPTDIEMTQQNIAYTYSLVGQFDDAINYYLRALELARGQGNKRNAAIESHNMGTVFEYQGRYGAALKAKGEALKTMRDLGERGFWLAAILSSYGNELSQVGRFEEAQKALDEAMIVAREIQSNPMIVQTLNFQADRFFYLGDAKAARGLFDHAFQAASRIGNRRQVLLSKIGLAKVEVKDGRSQKAISALRDLIREFDAAGLKYSSAECSLYLGEALLNDKNYPGAQRELEGTLRKSEKLGSAALLAKSHFLLATALHRTSQPAEASRHYAQARRILDDIRKEAGTDSLLKRSDLSPIVTQSSR